MWGTTFSFTVRYACVLIIEWLKSPIFINNPIVKRESDEIPFCLDDCTREIDTFPVFAIDKPTNGQSVSEAKKGKNMIIYDKTGIVGKLGDSPLITPWC